MTKVFQILEEAKQEEIIRESRLATMEEKRQTAARMIRKRMACRDDKDKVKRVMGCREICALYF